VSQNLQFQDLLMVGQKVKTFLLLELLKTTPGTEDGTENEEFGTVETDK